MNNLIIPEKYFKESGAWLDDETFVASVSFMDFPPDLLQLFPDLICPEDIDDGYLCAELWLANDESDIDAFVYTFCFENDTVNVNEYFCKQLYNDIMKRLAV